MRLPVEKWDEANVDDSLSYYNIATHDPSYRESPENNLSVAVLAEAISLMLKPKIPAGCRKDYILTQQWFKGEYESAPGFSFQEISERLGWDSARLLAAIEKYVEINRGRAIKGLFIRSSTRGLEGDVE